MTVLLEFITIENLACKIDEEAILESAVIRGYTGLTTEEYAKANEKVNLPQTVNNSLRDLMIKFGGFLTTTFDFLMFKFSMVIMLQFFYEGIYTEFSSI